jgi:hypothetical protein
MYQFSRGIYRELAADIIPERDAHQQVLHACEETVQRMATDRHYFARPARTLFRDIRRHFPMSAQARVLRVVQSYVSCADAYLAQLPHTGCDVNGNMLQCRAMTRRGTPCQRTPLRNGYCPSHQHLVETETAQLAA